MYNEGDLMYFHSCNIRKIIIIYIKMEEDVEIDIIILIVDYYSIVVVEIFVVKVIMGIDVDIVEKILYPVVIEVVDSIYDIKEN